MSSLRQKIFLVGFFKHQITGSKLPSNGDCLRVLFYNMRIAKLNFNVSASLVIEECVIYWKKAKIPTQELHKCKLKLQKLYEVWQSLSKTINRTSESLNKQRTEFSDSLNDLFDIAHRDALILIKYDEDKQFLIKQREKGRTGCMVGIDKKEELLEKTRQLRIEKENERKRKSADIGIPSTSAEFDVADSENCSSDSQIDCIEEEIVQEQEIKIYENPTKRPRKELLTSRLSAALDRCNVSGRDCIHLIMAFLDAVSLDPSSYVLNRTSISKQREQFRKKNYIRIKEKFSQLNDKIVTIHWDTKLLHDISGKSVERLAVIATGAGTEQLLGVPEIPAATGLEMASAVYDTLESWNLIKNVQAIGFDTTASNTGRIKGACMLLEQKLERDLLYFGCRHHVSEIVLAAVFGKSKFSISGPDIPLFKRFQANWSQVNTNNFVPGINSSEIRSVVGDDLDNILKNYNIAIYKKYPREDYRELIDLAIIFLGGIPPGGIQFKKPGAYHMARWMAKAIYALKIYLFRTEFNLTKNEEKSLTLFTCFIVKCYIIYWIYAPEAICAPLKDIQFLRKLYQYKDIDQNISEIAIGKLVNHLYYLTNECVAFSLFDDSISVDTKIKMVEQMTTLAEIDEDNKDYQIKKLSLNLNQVPLFLEKCVDDVLISLFNGHSKNIFQRYKIKNFYIYTHLSGQALANTNKVNKLLRS
ncbi:uncharacterized protein LOC126893767 [Daktulosphaira vitifoliae]|uniref:uncharacterized protein LOC126893767 n=1 Tax=Daktulosphaira vitifoliae TaxID=58002 RepID=UPI0021A9B1F9|nr:uncharacterized protein LOC126893767 [Daktulosphaira vitifoliae]